MRSLALLVVLVLVLLIAGSAFYFRGGAEGSSGAIAPGAMAPEASPGTEGQAADLARPTAEVAKVAVPDAGSERVAFEAPASRDATPAKVEELKKVRVIGRVIDNQDKPVVGAQVWAANSQGFAPLPLDAEGFDRFGWMKRMGAKTDAQGRFEIQGLEPGAMRLAVRASGFAPRDQNQIGLPAKAEHELEPVVLERGVMLSGRVVDSRGRGVGGARILKGQEQSGAIFFGHMGVGGSGGVLLAESESDGTYRVDQLASGPFNLRVATEEHPDKLETGVTERPGQMLALNIALEDGYEIRGRVDGAPADAMADLVVRASPGRAQEGVLMIEGDFMGGASESRQATPQADGSFAVRGLREGKSYSLQARRAKADFFGGSLSASVGATAGDRGVVLPYQPEAALVFQVTDAKTGAPLTKFEVSAGIDWPMPLLGEDRRQVREHPEGKVRFGNLRPKSDSERAQLNIAAVGYRDHARKDIPLGIARETDLGVIALEPVPMVRVTVVDDRTGAPVSAARVTLAEEVEAGGFGGARRFGYAVRAGDHGDEDFTIDDGESRTGKTDDQGVAELNSFEGEPCRLSVKHSGHATWRSEVFTPATGDDTEKTARLSEGGSVVVTLLSAAGAPLAGGRVEHRAPNEDFGFEMPGHGRPNVTDAEGQVEFAHLEPGVHRFRPAGAGADNEGPIMIARLEGEEPGAEGWQEVEVAEGGTSEVTLVAPVRVQVSGRIREGGQALAGARVSISSRGRDGGAERFMAMQEFMGGGPSAKTDGQGNYLLENVKSGEYTLTVRHPTRQMGADFDVRVATEDLRFDVELPVSVLEGRITDKEGKPLAGLRVWAERARKESTAVRQSVVRMVIADDNGGGGVFMGAGGGFQEVQANTDADGRYSLRGVLSDVDLQVQAEGEEVQKGRSETVRVAPDQVKTGVDFELEAAGAVEVLATLPDGSPAKGLLVTATMDLEGRERADTKTEFMQEGKLKLSGLAPGRWRVSLRRIGPGQSQGGEIPDQVVEVKVGENVDGELHGAVNDRSNRGRGHWSIEWRKG